MFPLPLGQPEATFLLLSSGPIQLADAAANHVAATSEIATPKHDWLADLSDKYPVFFVESLPTVCLPPPV